MNITDELERHAKQVMPNYPNDVCSRAKAEIERLRAENDRLGAALEIARCHVVDTNEAEGMMEGFGPRRPRPSDVDLKIIDEALGDPEQEADDKSSRPGQESP